VAGAEAVDIEEGMAGEFINTILYACWYADILPESFIGASSNYCPKSFMT